MIRKGCRRSRGMRLMTPPTPSWSAPSRSSRWPSNCPPESWRSPTTCWKADFHVVPLEFRARLIEGGAQELPILAEHVLAVSDLPSIHRDPFDRLLVAQAICEKVVMVTSDRTLPRYGAPILRA